MFKNVNFDITNLLIQNMSSFIMETSITFRVFLLICISAYTKASVVCGPGVHYLPNPADCGSYYQCSNYVPHLMHCPPSLVFSPILNVCVWPRDYDCQVTTTSGTTTTTSTTTTTEPTPTTTTEPASTERYIPCSENVNPGDCLSSPNNCAFCYDTCFGGQNNEHPRCDSYENLVGAGCQNFQLDLSDYGSIVDAGQPNCSVWLPVLPGAKRNITVSFKLEKHPMDLYYLMDFSGSMSDDKANLVRLSSRLIETLSNLTNDFHLGFGTFVDKPISPFGGYNDYSFRNNMPLTSNTEDFVSKIEASPILYGADGPESHADALAQVAECIQEIGWRGNARRVVLLATDIEFHIAGDGVAAGITSPYVQGCYLDSMGYYSEELSMDYPSVQQLANTLEKDQTITIFAVDSGSKSFYDNVASQIKSSVVGILNIDSSNVIDLVIDQFRQIDSKMEIEKSETTDTVQFKYFSNCMGESEEETNICENLPSDGEITFTIEIDLIQCPLDSSEKGMTVKFNPLGLPIFIEIALSYLCDK